MIVGQTSDVGKCKQLGLNGTDAVYGEYVRDGRSYCAVIIDEIIQVLDLNVRMFTFVWTDSRTCVF